MLGEFLILVGCTYLAIQIHRKVVRPLFGPF